jgi:hypothetical protein
MVRAACILLALALASCASSPRNEAERNWQTAECNRILDQKDRERCLRRVDDDYGGSHSREPAEGPRK